MPSIAARRRAPVTSSPTCRQIRRPLLAALGRLPRTGLHGDLKLANVGASRRWPARADRLGDDDARAGRGRARLVPRLEQRRPAARTGRRPRSLSRRRDRCDECRADARRVVARGSVGRGPTRHSHRARSRRPSATGRGRSTWPGSSGCSCAAGARASIRMRASCWVRASAAQDDLALWSRAGRRRGGTAARMRSPALP